MWKDFILGDGSKVVKKVEINGKVAFKRKSYTDTEFSSCPFPTTWFFTSDTEYYANNDYGKWTATSNGYTNSSHLIEAAFDNNSATYFETTTKASTSTPRWAQIDLPDGVLIKPSELRLEFRYAVRADEVQGYNPTTNEWETIGVLDVSSLLKKIRILSYTGNTYFSKFRLYSTDIYNSSMPGGSLLLYEFQITSGTLRKES